MRETTEDQSHDGASNVLERFRSSSFRSAIEPIIGHMKSDGHLGRCHLKGREGDAANVILSAVGHNLRRVLAWLRALLRLILLALSQAFAAMPGVRWAS
jgi:transposase, IS5 family